MTDCVGCAYPELECACCCKEKAVLEGLITRLNNYEFYLRTFAVPASCQKLPWSARLISADTMIGGANPKYAISKYVTGGNLGLIKLWPTVGCNCRFSCISMKFYKLDNDCMGVIPTNGSGGFVPMSTYLSDKYYSMTGMGATYIALSIIKAQVIKKENTRFGLILGAIDYIQEAKRFYNSLLISLPC